ncbi:MAG: chemotaxis response regulator protein-glutamate methylesterase [Bosea sp. (in: a-proteobacteria)]|uniref:chemotaxis response regulator protein-glutamate methylesterase n=1 Tax=unclassified Bosea (in: a-proteobacteria) TaxID=2653178 RepID=UPI00095EA48C|nr:MULTISPECIES: chemotaxis response regulator protein-glutamate methylesterase [unclassified Bosea (in: a-proteobacteria)]MBN9456505.1 chemotaxis response regulator protein-glutamate methylesterase [Bosea sp. (in: a-proteobacteria)]OJV08750.1 MAG: chemotaxis response regulator protein-glutamate methylesterase [Bosea sp. 67-29]
MRVGIVNDLPLAVELLRRLVSSSAEHKVAWIAMNGREAVDACRRDRPDLVLMDLNMPVMDGVEATRLIMAEAPCPILLVTASVDANVSGVYDAMGYGALDAVDIPAAGLNGEASVQGRALLARMAAIERLSRDETRGGQRPAPPPAKSSARHPLIAIGASAGGPAAVAALLGALPPDFGAAIVLVQHLDAQFVPGFATWLGQQCSLPVRPAEAGDRPVAGAVLIAASGDHLVLGPNGELGYNADPRDYPYRPSVDVFFESAATNWRGELVGVLLTGMGRDGARGLKLLRERHHLTIAQDKATSAVYGMPKAAAAIGAAVEILPLTAIAPRLAGACGRPLQ